MNENELIELMEEPAGGHNHGRQAMDSVMGGLSETQSDGLQPLGTDAWQAEDFMRTNGWTAVDTNSRAAEAGMTTHRGVLHPDEYVDRAELRRLVEAELGFTYEQIRAVYRQGPLSAQARELRGRIDARLLALSRAGGNMVGLARAVGLTVQTNGTCRAFDAALVRARGAE